MPRTVKREAENNAESLFCRNESDRLIPVKRKNSILIEEIIIWFRSRFTLTGEEKNWILLILLILWVGLVARYFHQKDRRPHAPPPAREEKLLPPSADGF